MNPVDRAQNESVRRFQYRTADFLAADWLLQLKPAVMLRGAGTGGVEFFPGVDLSDADRGTAAGPV